MKAVSALVFSYLIMGSFLTGCNQAPEKNKEIVVMENGNKKVFGVISKDTIYSYTLQNGHGIKAVVSNYGGTLLELWTPDRSAKSGDIILGYDSLEGYLQKGNPFFGALVGRYANRIANAKFSIEGKQFILAANDHGNTLHGGIKGFDKVIWTVDGVNDSSLALSYTSPDAEEGFPGTLTVKVVYTIMEDNGLKIDYTAVSDKKTPINLTNHAYFNLSAGKDSTILKEVLTLHASHYTPVNESLIPTGQIAPVKNTAMDFITGKKIGKDIGRVKGGYDHNFVIDKTDSGITLAASVYDEATGRYMEVWTTQPGIQFYTGNFLDGSLKGRDGKKIVQHAALCLETQHFPDSPNQPGFPSSILDPGQTYRQTTIYKFSIKK